MVDLGTLGGTGSDAWSINSSNTIVGKSYVVGDVIEHAFIAVSNTMVDLNSQLDTSSNSWVLTKAEYINDAGMICGYGTNNGARHGFLLVVPSPPGITSQPTNLTVLLGSNATFNVTATGTAPLRYQWRFNTTTNLPSATNSSLTITNTKATNAGNYTLVITNNYGSATSSVAALSVVPAPVITSISRLATNVVLGFTTATGATYFVENRTNIVLGSWSNAVQNIAGTGGTKTVTNTGGGTTTNRFYRVRVTVP
jgi:hypothetical protein